MWSDFEFKELLNAKKYKVKQLIQALEQEPIKQEHVGESR